MICQANGSTTAIRRHRVSRAGLAASFLMAVGPPGTPKALAMDPITLALPSMATISLVSGKTISGVRLTALGPSEVNYEKGGRRSVPVGEVKSISFSGLVSLEAKHQKIIRGSQLTGCRGPREMPILGSALLVQTNGEAMALDSTGLESSVSRDLRQASRMNTLVVNTLHFDPDGKVRLEYKSCSPGQ